MSEQKAPRITFAPDPSLRDFVPGGEPSAVLHDCRMTVAFHRLVTAQWPESVQQAAASVAMGAAQDAFRASMENSAAAAGFRLVWKDTEREAMRHAKLDANDPLAELRLRADELGLSLVGPGEAGDFLEALKAAEAVRRLIEQNTDPKDWN